MPFTTTTSTLPKVSTSPVNILVGQNGNGLSAKEDFKKTEKTFRKVVGSIGGVSLVGIAIGTIASGLTFPKRFLKVVGGLFASAATLAAPYFMIKNEFNNYYDLRGDKKTNNSSFDHLREGFYRCSSLGFVPFIFEQFVDPKTWTKSIFHTGANIANIPNLLFTGYTWAYGNFQAITAWWLRTQEGLKGENADQEKIRGLDEIYSSCKRRAQLGSIANPTLQGLNQFADSLAFLTGKMPKEEFFDSIPHGLGRLVSLLVGVPESFAKGVDSLLRVTVKEKEHLRFGVPKPIFNLIETVGKRIEPMINKDGPSKAIKNIAEATFHTLSPLSMWSLFVKQLGEKQFDEETRNRGGLSALFDKVVGRTGKTLTLIFTGLYTTFGRLPQSAFQLTYFVRKYWGQFVKGEDLQTTQRELLKLKQKISNSFLVNGTSKYAKKLIEKLMPDFYTNEEIEHGFPSFEFIQAKYALEQGSAKFSDLLKPGNKLNDSEINSIVEHCLSFVENNAKQSYRKITDKEKEQISEIIKERIRRIVNPKEKDKRKVKLAFPGADLLVRFVLRGLDTKTRLEKTDWTFGLDSKYDDYRNKETAYTIDELWNFDAELIPVLLKCVDEFRLTGNRITAAADILTSSGSILDALKAPFTVGHGEYDASEVSYGRSRT